MVVAIATTYTYDNICLYGKEEKPFEWNRKNKTKLKRKTKTLHIYQTRTFIHAGKSVENLLYIYINFSLHRTI